MKINEFTLRNFKSFGDQAIATGNKIYGLSTFNMIYGNNNSGKSNILKFIKLIFSKKKLTESIVVENETIVRERFAPFWSGTIENEPFIFHHNIKDNSIEFSFIIDITDEELKAHNSELFSQLEKFIKLKSNHKYYTLEINGSIINYGDKYDSNIELSTVKLNSGEIFVKETAQYFEKVDKNSDLSGSQEYFESLLSILEDNILFIDTDRFLRTENAELGKASLDASSYKTWLYNLSLDTFSYKRYNKIIEFIKQSSIAKKMPLLKSFNPSFAIDNGRLELMLKNGDDRYPISSFGTSIQQFLFLITSLSQNTSRILLIEELELNLSPENQSEFLNLLNDMVSKGLISQIIFTTHSRYFSKRNDFSIYEVNYVEAEKRSTVKKVAAVSSSFYRSRTLD